MTSTDPALVEAARAAGLVDQDLLQLAAPGLPPAQALANLRDRYPAAFVRRASAMGEAEFKLAVAAMAYPAPVSLPDSLHKHRSEMTLDEIEAWERFNGIRITSSERLRRQQVRDARHARREMRG